MEATQNAKTNNRGLRKILIVFAVMLSVGAYAWFFWFQTLMVIQTHYYYRDIPIASMTLVELNDPASPRRMTQSCRAMDMISRFRGKDVETDKIQRKSMTLIPFRSGLSVLVGHGSTHDLLDTIMERTNTNPQNFQAEYSDAPVRSHYDLLGLALNATPARVRPFESKQEIGRQTALLMIKAIIVPGDSGIFKVQTGEFKGFQYGDPNKHPKKVTVFLLSASGSVEISFSQKDMSPLTISQSEINRAIQTMHRADPPTTTPSTASASLRNLTFRCTKDL